MKKFSITAKAVIVTIGLIGTAYADESFSQHSLLNSWTGFYVGADAGIAYNQAQLQAQQLGFCKPSGTYYTVSKVSTFIPGIQVGYMYQFPNYWVSGIEANVTVNTNQTDTFNWNAPYNNPGYDRFAFKNWFQSSIKGKVGRSINWDENILLPYVTAGVSFANVGLTYQNEGGNYYSASTTSSGWLVGAGVEWVYNKNWSLRAEYSYVDYGTAINMNIPNVYGLVDPNGGARVKLNSNNVMLSVNYWV